MLRTLAAALAECGRFPEALTNATQAMKKAELLQNHALAAVLQSDVNLFSNGQPLRDPQVRGVFEAEPGSGARRRRWR